MSRHARPRHVVKVQASLFGATEGCALVYAEGRKHLCEQPLPPVVTAHLETRPFRKAFFEAWWNGRTWQLGALTGDQPW